jgi:uncharacterized protein YjbJ (UPF0337 family)
MGSISDKIKGTGNELMGKAKQGVGEMTDNQKLKAEGHLQEGKGVTQKAVGKAKDAVKKTVDRL